MHPVAACGRNGASIVLRSETHWTSVCRTVAEPLALVLALELERLGPRDVGVDLADDAHRLGDRRLLAVPLEQAADGVEAGEHGGADLLVDRLERPRRGTSPKFFATIAAVRETRLPHPATSSELLRCTNSRHVKFASWLSGPAAQMK